jgi:outer membrane protein assembly factor BamB
MRRLTGPVIISCCCAFLSTGLAHAQFGRGGGWTTAGADAQRSFWVRTDAKISRDSLQKPGFQLLWKVKLNNQPVQLNSLTTAVTLEGYIGYRGFRTLAHLGGSANHVFAVDTDLGKLEWEKDLPSTASQSGSAACPGGMTAEVSRPTPAAILPPPAARGGGGNRGGARSGVGEGGEGAVTLAAAASRAGAAAMPPRAGAPGAPDARGGGRGPGAPGRGPGGGRGAPNAVYALTSDGKLHSMLVSNGDDTEPPLDFLPANANAHGLIIVDNAAYVATSEGCGGAANGLWAIDLVSKEVATWKPEGGIAGTLGPAFDTDGSLYAATIDGKLVHLEAKTLKPKESYSAGKGFASTPVVFAYKFKTLVAVAGKDGSIHLLDTAALGGSDGHTPLSKTAALSTASDFAPGALASWQDSDGTRWILASTGAAVTAWKVVDQNGAPTLQSGWVSHDMVSPLTPMIINGVVFAVSSGEFQPNDSKLPAAERIRRSSPAVLYALDSATGKELWNSGKAITSFVHGGTLSGGGTQIYLETYDGNLYAFGFYIEH